VGQIYHAQKTAGAFVISKTEQARRNEQLRVKQTILKEAGVETIEQILGKIREIDERVAKLEGGKIASAGFKTAFEEQMEVLERT